MTKSLEAVVAIYGVLLSGAAYVPLDPGAPPARIGYIAGNCGIRVLLSGRTKARTWAQVVAEGAQLTDIVIMDADPATEVDGVSIHPPPDGSSAGVGPGELGEDDLAFILYTSGSTGDPKGVMLSHANCLGFVDWAVREFKVGPDDRLSSHAPFHFDLSTFDLFGAAAAAARVVLVPPKLSVFPVEVVKFIDEYEISVWYSVPSILSMIIEHVDLSDGDLASLRTVLFAGEVFPTKYLSRLMHALPAVDFANLYGPTETNVCTWYRVPVAPEEDEPPISIGAAIDDVETFVVDGDREVTAGAVGELLVRGPTVMKGYWGDPERTGEKLMPSPLGRHNGELIYRTGDLVQEMPDGNYKFLGRRDNQIKSRGYRIELGDIESAIGLHADVFECGVVAVPDELISNRIECFVSAKPGSVLDKDDLVRFAAEKLPRYMIPEQITVLEELPKTSTGKIDRQTLLRAVSA